MHLQMEAYIFCSQKTNEGKDMDSKKPSTLLNLFILQLGNSKKSDYLDSNLPVFFGLSFFFGRIWSSRASIQTLGGWLNQKTRTSKMGSSSPKFGVKIPKKNKLSPPSNIIEETSTSPPGWPFNELGRVFAASTVAFHDDFFGGSLAKGVWRVSMIQKQG